MANDDGLHLKMLTNTPAWEWPGDSAEYIQKTLADADLSAEQRETAADLAGDLTVMNNDLAGMLLAIVSDPNQPETLRATAAVSLGPVLQLRDETLDDEDVDDFPITDEMFAAIRQTLKAVFEDEANPKLVRRRVLEASIRAPEEWHKEAVRQAYVTGDREWVLTAAFAMQAIRGFNDEILESLRSTDEEILYAAVVAAGGAELRAAYPQILALLEDRNAPKELLVAAITAAGAIQPEDALEKLGGFLDSTDEDVVDAASDAISMAGVLEALDEEELLEEGEEEE